MNAQSPRFSNFQIPAGNIPASDLRLVAKLTFRIHPKNKVDKITSLRHKAESA